MGCPDTPPGPYTAALAMLKACGHGITAASIAPPPESGLKMEVYLSEAGCVPIAEAARNLSGMMAVRMLVAFERIGVGIAQVLSPYDAVWNPALEFLVHRAVNGLPRRPVSSSRGLKYGNWIIASPML